MRGGICGYQLYSSTEITAQLPVSQIKMPITTCQKVTLISCSVLCVSLFLPRILLPARKEEMGQPEGESAYQIIIIIHHHPAPSPSICACVSLMSLLLTTWTSVFYADKKYWCVFASMHCIPFYFFVNIPSCIYFYYIIYFMFSLNYLTLNK